MKICNTRYKIPTSLMSSVYCTLTILNELQCKNEISNKVKKETSNNLNKLYMNNILLFIKLHQSTMFKTTR